MSNPASASDNASAENELSAEDGLSAEDLELLRHARRGRQEESVPAAIRQRLLARVIEEEQRGRERLVVPATHFVAVERRAFGSAIWLSGAMALCLVALANARGWLPGSIDGSVVDSEPSAQGAAAPERVKGERLLDMPLFRASAQPLPSNAFPPVGRNLFEDRPFSSHSQASQVRRWDDLRAEPTEPATHDFEAGALCVALGAGERVLGGWPWATPPGLSPTAAREGAAGHVASESVAPKAVALVAGKHYRLSFKAWAREPLPAQLLIAVGHARLPFSAAAGARVAVASAPRAFGVSFVSPRDDPSVGIAFLATHSAGAEPTRVCLSDVTLTEGGPF